MRVCPLCDGPVGESLGVKPRTYCDKCYPSAAVVGAKASSLAYARARAAFVRRHKNRPCTDCGGRFHYAAMQFDHLPETTKRFGLAEYHRHTVTDIIDEIAKCDVVCSNCHAVRSWERQHGHD